MGNHPAQVLLLSALLTLMADDWYDAVCRPASFFAMGLRNTQVDIRPTCIWLHVRICHPLQLPPYYIDVLVARNLDVWGQNGGICKQRPIKMANSRRLARIYTQSDFRIVSFLTSWV